jgi:hypothetical protein
MSDPGLMHEIHFACRILLADFFVGLFFDPEGGRSKFLRNVCELLAGYTALYPIK